VDLAVNEYRECFQLVEDAQAATYLAEALLFEGDLNGAIQVLQQALWMDSGYAAANCHVGKPLV